MSYGNFRRDVELALVQSTLFSDQTNLRRAAENLLMAFDGYTSVHCQNKALAIELITGTRGDKILLYRMDLEKPDRFYLRQQGNTWELQRFPYGADQPDITISVLSYIIDELTISLMVG